MSSLEYGAAVRVWLHCWGDVSLLGCAILYGFGLITCFQQEFALFLGHFTSLLKLLGGNSSIVKNSCHWIDVPYVIQKSIYVQS